MMLEATDLGLGSVWICYFNPDVIRSEFGLPDNLEPVNMLAIGYADTSDEPVLSPERYMDTSYRKPLSEIVFYK